ncbi:MAG: TRAP transporter substrate-binding protein DctP [Desulfatibacillum sp.]|nr:TRAP transporter substrate-binding protein DctP [Desulfatibacillum sp.]
MPIFMCKSSRHVFWIAFLALISFLSSPGLCTELASPQHVWKFGTLAPDGTSWALPIKRVLFPLIQKETDGLVKVKVYWGGSMGDDEDILRKIRIGQLDGAGFSAQGATLAAPEMSVLELPFLFNDYNEVDIIKYSMFPAFDKIMEERGFFLIAWVDQDFDQIYSNGRPVATLEDFAKLKFGSWYGPVEERFLQEFGANLIQVNVPEFATNVRQGVVDASIGPAMWIVGAQLYSKVEYVNPIKIRYSPGVILCRKELWEAYPELEQYKQRLLELRVPLSEAYCTIVRTDNQKALKAMIQYGVKPVHTDSESMAQMRAISEKLRNKLAQEEMYPQELLDEIQGRIQAYRNLESCAQCVKKQQEVLQNVARMREEVVEIWNSMSPKGATDKDLEDILERANAFNDIFSRAQTEIRIAIRNNMEQAALETINRVETQGLWADPALHIALPDLLQPIQRQMIQSGLKEPCEALAKSLNEAATQMISINRKTIMALVKQNGEDPETDSAALLSISGESLMTENFERIYRDTLVYQIGKDVPEAIQSSGLSSKYQIFIDSAQKLSPEIGKPIQDWNQYITEKTLDAFFVVMAQEEQKLRNDPNRQVLPVLEGILEQLR